MKKISSLMIVLMMAILLVGCKKEKAEEFSFKGLNVNLQGAQSIGLAILEEEEKSASLFNFGLTVKAEQNNQTYKLVTRNELGEVSEIQFKDENGKEVEVPYEPYEVDVQGNYTFIAYYHNKDQIPEDGTEEMVKEDFESNVTEMYLHEQDSIKKNGKVLTLMSMGLDHMLDFVLIHNPSGKVFSLTEISENEELNIDLDTSTSPSVRTSFSNLLISFHKSFVEDNDIILYRGAVMRLRFNEQTKELDVTGVHYDTTAPLDLYGYHNKELVFLSDQKTIGFIKEDLLTTVEKTIDLYTPLSELIDLESTLTNELIWKESRVTYMNQFGQNYVLFVHTPYGKNVVYKFDMDLNEVDVKVVEEIDVSNPPYLVNNKLVFVSQHIQTIDLDTFVVQEQKNVIKDSSLTYTIGNSIYIFGDEQISVYDLDEGTLQLIDDSVSSPYRFKEGYITYKSDEGILTSVNKTFNLETGELEVGDINTPIKTTKSFKPLN